MTRNEYPRLYDDLIRFPGGTRRINRLRTLAHDGLLVQPGGANQVAPEKGIGPDEDKPPARLTNQIFEPPLSE